MSEGTGLSAGDVLAMTRSGDNFLEGNGIIILILFFLIFGFGGMGFGGNGLTQAELQAGLYNQTTDRNLADIRDALCSNNTQMLNSTANISRDVLENRYTNSLGQCSLQKDILLGNQTILQKQNDCCCENRLAISEQTNAIVSAIKDDGETTRALITNNRIADLEKELSQAQIVASNQVQTQNILNALGRYYTTPSVNPYTAYNCGCSNV